MSILNVNFFVTAVGSTQMTDVLTATETYFSGLTTPRDIENVNLLGAAEINGATCPCFLEDPVVV